MKKLPPREQIVARHQQKLADPRQAQHNESGQPIFENFTRCLSIADLASFTGLSTKTCEKLVRSGDIRAKKVGRRWVIPASEYESWLSKK